MEEMKRNRLFMQCPVLDGIMDESDQKKGLPHPVQGNPPGGALITLPSFEDAAVHDSYTELLDIRRSERHFSGTPMTQKQLAFLLWSSQGVQAFRGAGNVATLRPVPSGGARHPFELYMIIQNVEGLEPGAYRYAPMENPGRKIAAIEFLRGFDSYEEQITKLLMGQSWAGKAPAVLFLSCVPYRAEWRYRQAAHRVMLIDLGHAGQNMMLSAAALGLGSCCVAAYDQKLCDEFFGLDGVDEYTVYAVPVGKV